MASKETFDLYIVTPDKRRDPLKVQSLTAMTSAGQVTILPHHESYLANIEISLLTLTINGVKKHYAVEGGTLLVKNAANAVYLITQSIESVAEVDKQAILLAKKKAEAELKKQNLSIEEQRKAELSLREALNLISLKDNYND